MGYYLAQAVLQATLIIRPDKIILGGSVVGEQLLKKIRQQFNEMIDGYIELPSLDQYITRPKVVNNGSATIGNIALGLREAQS